MKLVFVPLFLLLASGWAWAGEDDLNQAERLYKQMRYDKAITAVTHALESPNNNPEQLVEAYKLQGLCLSALGRTEESVMAFRRLLAINPVFHLSHNVSPKLMSPFSKALNAEQKPIALSHEPPGTVRKLAGQDLEVTLQSDPLGMVSSIRLLFWAEDNKENKLETAVIGPGKVLIRLPQEIKAVKISYYFEAANKFGGVLYRAGTKDKPFEVQIKVGQPPALTGLPGSEGQGGSVAAMTANGRPLTASESDQEKKTAGRPFYKTWWFWTVVGVAVVGAAVGTGIAIAKGKETSSANDYYSITVTSKQ
jgi:hypothetical protein